MSPKLDINQKRVAILAELAKGEIASDLAKKYEVTPNTIGKWKKEARIAAMKEEAVELSAIEPEVLTSVIQEVKNKAESNPNLTAKQFIKIDTQLDKLKEGVTSLQVLDKAFHDTMLNMLMYANERLTDDDIKTSEWTQLVNGIATMHKALFGKDNVNNVNIVQANNGGGDPSIASFKAGFRN